MCIISIFVYTFINKQKLLGEIHMRLSIFVYTFINKQKLLGEIHMRLSIFDVFTDLNITSKVT